MGITLVRSAVLAAVVIVPLGWSVGCTDYDRRGMTESGGGPKSDSQQISRTESDKNGWFGGKTHEVNTEYKNPDGSTSIETETTTNKNGTTTITRERKTTFPDGRVRKDRETRTIVKGTDNVETESKTSN